MTRDMDLVRNLLLKLQDEGLDGNLYRLDVKKWVIGDHTYDEIAFQLFLLIRAGFVEGERELCGSFVARTITWKGYDFLDAVKDDGVWARTKEVAHKAGGFTVEILLDIAKSILKANLGRLTGGALGL